MKEGFLEGSLGSEAPTAALARGGRPEALSDHLSLGVSRELQEPSFKPTVWSNSVIFQMKSLELGEAQGFILGHSWGGNPGVITHTPMSSS